MRVDGEGYIGIKRTRRKDCPSPVYIARIQVRMVDEGAIAFLASTLGGNYYREGSNAKRRPLYCFAASNRKAEAILRSVRPYLIVKARVTDVVLAFRDLQAQSRQHRTKVIGHHTLPHWSGKELKVPTLALSDDYLTQCAEAYEHCKRLNRPGA